jgi:hypothetical protein
MDPRTKITVSITSAPERMCLNEVRPINAFGEDLDLWKTECGHGAPPPTCQFANVHDQAIFCDEVFFSWEVDDESSGAGEFIRHGRTALFRATQRGRVIVLVTIRDENSAEILTSEPIEFDVGEYQEHEILYKTFISCGVVPNPNSMSSYRFFNGNNRGPGYGLGADFTGSDLGSKTAQRYLVVDPDEPWNVDEQFGFGETKGYGDLGISGPFSTPCGYDQVFEVTLVSATQTSLLEFDEGPPLPTPTLGSARRFLITINAYNPLEPLSALCPITANMTLDLRECGDEVWYRAGGTASKYPYHEMYLNQTQIGLQPPSDPDDTTLLCDPVWIFPLGEWQLLN